MAKKLKITKEQILKMERKARRDVEIENNPLGGWTRSHSVHRSKKTYIRKPKHRKNIW